MKKIFEHKKTGVRFEYIKSFTPQFSSQEIHTLLNLKSNKEEHFAGGWEKYFIEITPEPKPKLYTIDDIVKCVENWGICKVESEYIEKFLNK